MAETQTTPETDKPNPVSLREYHLMDRRERKAFLGKLTNSEKKDLRLAAVVAMESKPRSERREMARELVSKLEKRENPSVGDRVELLLAKKEVLRLTIPEKPAIFLRKLRTKAFPWPRWIRETHSPYLITGR